MDKINEKISRRLLFSFGKKNITTTNTTPTPKEEKGARNTKLGEDFQLKSNHKLHYDSFDTLAKTTQSNPIKLSLT